MSKKQDPAFLFYTSDFLAGVSDLTMEERGQYITLLCLQHQKGHLSKKNIGIAVPNATADTMAKFKIDENGLYYNERLEIEINNRKAFTEKQRQRAVDGWEKRKSKLTTTANATALPLVNVNENKDLNKETNIGVNIFSNDSYFSEELFLEWFNKCRIKINLPSNIKKLSRVEQQYFCELKNVYTIGEFKNAFKGFSKDAYFKENNMLFPTHFLKVENFTKFLNFKEKTLGEKLMG